MNLDTLIPKLGSRSLLAGKTGTGKTTLARFILSDLHYKQRVPSIVIIDPKGTFKFDGMIIDAVEEAQTNQAEPVLIYRPNPDNSVKDDVDAYDRLLKWIYRRGNTVLYIDEAYALAPDGITYPNAIRPLYTRGREFGVTVIAATQRPVHIPRVMYTEAEYFYCFALNAKSDRERIAEMIGEEAKQSPEGYAFWHYSPDVNTPQYLSLNLKGG